jgi:diguanylate cyclase (GGDEF)-like protein
VNILHWFDNRTALACQALISIFFGASILLVCRMDRRIRGGGGISSGFFIGAIGCMLVGLRGFVPNFTSIVIANVLIFVAYWLLYCGIRRYFGFTRHPLTGYALVLVTCCLQLFFTVGHNSIVARIMLIGIYIGVVRLMMAETLFRHARRQLHRNLFAYLLCALAVTSFARSFFTYLHGAPQNYLQQNTVQTYALLSGMLFAAVEGVFCLILISHEITSRLSHQAQQDPLTGAYNRRTIEEKVREELARGARTGTTTAALLIDVDHLKTINDTLGHAAGDTALKLVAEAITSCLRPFDHLGRFGGDEFLLILPEIGIEDALTVADRFRTALALLPSAPTLSIGIAQSDPGESAPSLLARADTALYQAKSGGRNCIRSIRSGDPVVPHPVAPTRR